MGSPKSAVPSEFEFHGFDGNNESAELQYARFLIKGERRFTYLEPGQSEVPNSHHPTLEMYHRMVDEWESRGRSMSLTGDDIKAITGAQVHPSNRSGS